MITAKITNIRSKGSWDGNYGTMYRQEVTFDNGTVGQANSKTPQPWYKIGDTVRYTVNGEHDGLPKLKIEKDEDFVPQGGGSGGKKKTFDSTGQTVGMAINNAVSMFNAGHIAKTDIIPTAKWIAQQSMKLVEELKPKPAQREFSEPNMQSAHTQPSQPPAGPANDDAGASYDDDDVPF